LKLYGGDYATGNVCVGIFSQNWGWAGENMGFLAYSYFLFMYQFVKISHKCGQIYMNFICIFICLLLSGKSMLKETRLGRILQLIGTQKCDLSQQVIHNELLLHYECQKERVLDALRDLAKDDPDYAVPDHRMSLGQIVSI